MLDRPGSQSSVLDVDQPRVVGLDQISRDPQDFALNADLNQLCWRSSTGPAYDAWSNGTSFASVLPWFHQLDFVIPGSSPRWAISRKRIRDTLALPT